MLKAFIYAWWRTVKSNYKRIAFSILLTFSILTPVNLLLLIALYGMDLLDATFRAMMAALAASVYFSVNICLLSVVAGYVMWKYMGFEPDCVINGMPVIDPVKAVERMKPRHLAAFMALYALFVLPLVLALRRIAIG